MKEMKLKIGKLNFDLKRWLHPLVYMDLVIIVMLVIFVFFACFFCFFFLFIHNYNDAFATLLQNMLGAFMPAADCYTI